MSARFRIEFISTVTMNIMLLSEGKMFFNWEFQIQLQNKVEDDFLRWTQPPLVRFCAISKKKEGKTLNYHQDATLWTIKTPIAPLLNKFVWMVSLFAWPFRRWKRMRIESRWVSKPPPLYKSSTKRARNWSTSARSAADAIQLQNKHWQNRKHLPPIRAWASILLQSHRLNDSLLEIIQIARNPKMKR